MSAPPGVLLLGAAHVHLPDHLRSIEAAGWRLAAVHDRDPARAERVASAAGAVRLTDVAEADARGCRAAIVCSETAHHGADVAAALRLDLPVLCEKPFGFADPGPAAPLSVAYFHRLCEPLARLAREVREGAYGEAPRIEAAYVHDGARAGWLDLDGWMTRPDLALHGGFGDLGAHLVDWLLLACGEPVQARAELHGSRPGRLELGGVGHLVFAGGAEARIEAGWTAEAKRLELRVEGADGHAVLADGVLSARPWRGAPWRERLDPPPDAGWSSVEFLAAVTEGRAPRLATGAEAARIDAVLDAMSGRIQAVG